MANETEKKAREPKKIVVWLNDDKIENALGNTGWYLAGTKYETIQKAREAVKLLASHTQYHICTSHQFGEVQREIKETVKI